MMKKFILWSYFLINDEISMQYYNYELIHKYTLLSNEDIFIVKTVTNHMSLLPSLVNIGL